MTPQRYDRMELQSNRGGGSPGLQEPSETLRMGRGAACTVSCVSGSTTRLSTCGCTRPTWVVVLARSPNFQGWSLAGRGGLWVLPRTGRRIPTPQMIIIIIIIIIIISSSSSSSSSSRRAPLQGVGRPLAPHRADAVLQRRVLRAAGFSRRHRSPTRGFGDFFSTRLEVSVTRGGVPRREANPAEVRLKRPSARKLSACESDAPGTRRRRPSDRATPGRLPCAGGEFHPHPTEKSGALACGFAVSLCCTSRDTENSLELQRRTRVCVCVCVCACVCVCVCVHRYSTLFACVCARLCTSTCVWACPAAGLRWIVKKCVWACPCLLCICVCESLVARPLRIGRRPGRSPSCRSTQ